MSIGCLGVGKDAPVAEGGPWPGDLTGWVPQRLASGKEWVSSQRSGKLIEGAKPRPGPGEGKEEGALPKAAN